MKKRLKRITIGLLIILLVLGAFITITNANGAYSNTNRKVIIGVGNNGEPISYNLDNADTVNLIENTNWPGYDDCVPILEQPNVWCVQRGKDIGNTSNPVVTYKVGKEIEVSDPILAYILANGPKMNGKLLDFHGNNPHQNALWTYLNSSSYNSTDKNNILGSISSGAGNNTTEVNNILQAAQKYKTKINNITPTLETEIVNNKLKITVGGSFEEFELKVGDTEKTTYQKNENETKVINLNISELPTDSNGKVTIKLVPKITRYTVKYRILKNTNNQRLLVVTVANESDELEDGVTTTVQVNTDVSLQKYITKVNGESLTTENTTLKDRKNTKTDTKETNVNVRDKIKKGVTASENYKKPNAVEIEAGDTVTYRVYVYNNSNINASKVLVKDSVPYYLDKSKNVISYATIESIYIDGNSTDIKTNWTQDKDDNGNWNNYNTYKYTIDNLGAGAETYFDITLKFNMYTDNILTNTAWISKTEPTNSNQYRLLDRDYVKMKKYSVSLEKFVTQVNDENINEDRSGKRYNGSLKDGDKNKNVYKKDNKVLLEPGDKVTFTIRLKNTGDTPVKVTQIYDSFKFVEAGTYNGLKLVYDEVYGIQGNGGGRIINYNYGSDEENNANKDLNRYLIEFNNPVLLAKNGEAGDFVDVTLKFTVDVPKQLTIYSLSLQNKAAIVSLENRNDIEVKDSDGTDNNVDQDWVKTKTYAVSLEKFVSKVNGEELKGENANIKQREGKAEHNYDDNSSTNNSWKYNNVVTVSNGDIVTYTIKVKNDSKDTSVYITEIKDYLPDGVKYQETTLDGNEYNKTTDNEYTFDTLKDKLLAPGEEASFTIEVEVIENNLSLNILKNTAKITSMENKNQKEVEDTTQKDNEDSDYIELNYTPDEPDDPDDSDIIISGTVWNDKALDKNANNYDGLYDNEKETSLSNIAVYLYRNGVTEPIAYKLTDDKGYYYFRDSDISEKIVTNPKERYIKGPKEENSNRWSGKYYSYYIVFEYDGITYTSTKFADITSNNSLDSNAKEDGEKVKENRIIFNSRFSKINNQSRIEYTTKNEEGYIPSSNHVYNPRTMAIQSSTNLISLSDSSELEIQLKHVNLGLRGRDIFDLELISDVDKVKVTVNGKQGVYNYSNKVTLRKSDINQMPTYGEDMANTISEKSNNTYVDTQNQQIRTTDIKNEAYEDTGLRIEVTYKITVTNASQTDGTATKITNYYDNRYTFVKAYSGSDELDATTGDSGERFNSVIITTPGNSLTQSASMDIYVVLQLNSPTTALASLLNGTKAIPTYNMTEITEYATKCREGQTEYTRGLIDKDSAPGSVNKENVRLTTMEGVATATSGVNQTTLQYYFSDNDLSKLKYEDDTYAAPTLYFVSSDNQRTISGTVFRDSTTTDEETRIKTGNGKQDEGELGVYGATVELIEQAGDGKVRYTVNSGKDGKYTISGFLPGNYIIRYRYGDKIETVLLNQSDDGSVNKYSFNGEDYQATNNIGTYGATKLNSEPSFWYIYNEKEGISTGTDNVTRRNEVSENVTAFTDEQMTKLNDIRKGDNTDAIKSNVQAKGGLIEKTNMHAETPSMIFEVEETVIDNGNLTNRTSFGEYNVSNMNFGLAEVPVTTIDLQKYVTSFIIKDSTEKNTIASAIYNEENKKWDLKGNVLLTDTYNVQIEEEKLQGARLQITYTVKANMTTEKNFDNTSVTVPTINGIVDFIDNNLSYNPSLGDNDKYWETTTYEETQKAFNPQYDGINPKGTVDPEGTKHTVIVKAKSDNPILLNKTAEGKATITLEKVLSSEDYTVEDVITSTIDAFEYLNTVEITGLDYKNVTSEGKVAIPQRDRIRTIDKYIIIPGVQHDSAASEIISITPPTGGENYMPYYIIAVISLGVLSIGIMLIKKYIINKKNNA